MNTKKLLFLCAVLACGGGYLYFYELPHEKRVVESHFVFKPNPRHNFKEIMITRAGTTYTLVNSQPQRPEKKEDLVTEENEFGSEESALKGKISQDWKLVEKPNALLDAARIESLVADLGSLKPEGAIPVEEQESDLRLYGLADPVLKITAEKDGVKRTILFGKMNDFVGKRYIKIEDAPEIYLIEESIYLSADKDDEALRAKSPVDFSDDSVKEISLTFDSKVSKVIKDGSKDWRLIEPVKASGDNFVILDLLREVKNLSAVKFIDTPEDLSNFGLNKPIATLEIKSAGGKPLLIQFGLKDNAAWFRLNAEGTVYMAKEDTLAKIFPTVQGLRKKNFITFNPYSVKRIRIEQKDIPSIVVEQKENGNWTVDSKEVGDAVFIANYLQGATDVKADSFPDDNQPLSESEVTATIIYSVLDEDGKISEKKLYLKKDSSEWIKVAFESLNEPFFVRSDNLNKLLPSKEILVQSKVDKGADIKGTPESTVLPSE